MTSNARWLAGVGVAFAALFAFGAYIDGQSANSAAQQPVSVAAPAPALTTPAPATTPAAVALGQSQSWADNVTAAVSAPKAHQPTTYSTSRSGAARHILVTVTITNGSTASFPVNAWQVNATADGAALEKVFDHVDGVVSSTPPNSTVLPGRSVTFPVLWAVPTSAPAELQIEVQPAYMSGGLAGRPAVFVGQG